MIMPWRDRICALFIWVLVHGVAWCVDIAFDNPEDGFFLKSLYQKNKIYDPMVKTENFVLTRLSDVYNLKASSGPFEVHQVIQDDRVDTLADPYKPTTSSLVHYDVVFDFVVSAHIISDKLSPKWPKLQVLIHASPQHDNTRQRTKGSKVKSSSKSGFQDTPRRWCAHVYAQTDTTRLTSICVLSAKDKACVSSIVIPQDCFHSNSTLYVSYAFSHAEQNKECASASNTIVPGKAFEHPLTSKPKFITAISFARNEPLYDVKRDNQVLIYVPTEHFAPRSVFEIPVFLEANSDLLVFVMRARVRNGLKVTSAIAEADSPWQIHVDIKDKQKVGTVTARLDTAKYNTTWRKQQIFKWRMEVEDNVSNIGAARIIWSIEYERNKKHELYTAQESRIVSPINIRSPELETLVPIIKVREILNLALLTGHRQKYPLKIYSVKESGLTDVTGSTACHSAEEDVLKVASDCSSVYVDGTERRGSHNVTIITKSGRNTAFGSLRVWIPMEPLDIQLSDNKLSKIRKWKAPMVIQRYNRRGQARGKKVMDYCSLKLQQSTVEVYAKFYISTPRGTDFYKGKYAALKVTDLIKDRLRVTDPRIASLDGKIIQGQSQGRTEVQVLSPSRRPIAAKEIRVSNDRVSVKHLNITVVTGITLQINPSREIPGALTAISHVQSQLYMRDQNAVMEISIKYSDGTHFPLRYIKKDDYFLEVSSLNQHIIGVLEPYRKPYQPRIVARSDGSDDLLKVLLKLGDKCRKKRTKPLTSSYVRIESDFSPANWAINDPMFPRDDTNRASDRNRYGNLPDKHPTFNYNIKVMSEKEKERNMKFGTSKKKSNPLIPIKRIDLKDNLSFDGPATKKEPLKDNDDGGLSPFEIGMYVLLVFGVAFCVFLVNCIVFMVRYRKRMPRNKKESEYKANDWVWIGRATLERNAINTRCSQTLMPAEDFNGNHTQVVPSTSSGLGSSCSNSNNNSAQASNRSSFVSTIKGSECSIRITANPLLDSSGNNVQVDNNNQQHITDPEWDYEAMGMSYDQLVNYFDNLKESTA